MNMINNFLSNTPKVTTILLFVLWVIFLLDYLVLVPKGVRRLSFSRFVMGNVADKPGAIANALCLKYSKVMKGQLWRVFTAMLNHGGLLHIVFNSLALWVMGSLVEPHVGSGRFLLALLISGAGAAVCNMFVLRSEYSFGFSMAIYGGLGLLAAMLLRDPSFIQGINWVQRVVLLAYIIGAIPTDKYNWVEHSGGFICGIILAFFFSFC